MASILELTDQDFEREVLQCELPVLVDFWSPSCGPCRMLVPVLDELARDNEGDAVIAKINVADYPRLGARFEVDMLPTLLFFNEGHIVQRMVGAQSKDKIQDALDDIE